MPQLHSSSKLNHAIKRDTADKNKPQSRKGRKQDDLTEGLSITHPNAAGVDVGGDTHFVALPPGRAEQTVRTFGCFTGQLEALADWLIEHHIDTVVMESTGIYWVVLYELLIQFARHRHLHGRESYNARVYDIGRWRFVRSDRVARRSRELPASSVTQLPADELPI